MPLSREGGRGLLSIEDSYNRRVISTACKIANTTDPLLQFVKTHEANGKGAFLFSAAQRAAGLWSLSLNLTANPPTQNDLRSLEEKQLKVKIKERVLEITRTKHMEKPMHSQYYKSLEEQELDRALTFSFLSAPGLLSETEGFVMACQDGVFASKVYRKIITKENLQDTRCRACKKDEETTMHLLAACSKYAPNLYISRHDMALKVVYYHLRYEYKIDENKVPPFKEKVLPAVVSNDLVKIFWNFPFSTTAQIAANRPDMVVMLLQTKEMYVVEMSCPAERNITGKELEKRNKYRDLLFQLRLSYPGFKIHFIPLIIGVCGGISKSLIEGIKSLKIKLTTAKNIVHEMQKYVLLGSLRVLRAHDTSHSSA